MIDLAQLSSMIGHHGRVVRIVIAAHKGSTPRATGTSMLVWAGGTFGTIGGGRLEFDATARAHKMLAGDGPATQVTRQPLGPSLGQCCGGSVTLVTEVWDAERYQAEITQAAFPTRYMLARRVEGDRPLPRKAHRHTGSVQLTEGWLMEPLGLPQSDVYIYGAGHVGHALATVLAPLSQFDVTLIDPRRDLFKDVPVTVAQCWDNSAHELMSGAAVSAFHLIMTPDHAEDLELCHRVLQQQFGYAGLIGSATKWARFQKRLAALGHSHEQIARITCPIGDPALGKEPQAIAIGVATDLMQRVRHAAQTREVAA